MTLDLLLTIDFDAESPWLVEDPDDARYDLTQLSLGGYGPRRGIRRVISILDRLGIRATFFVPGRVAEMHPDVVRALHADGHEIGHHGYRHVPPITLSAAEQHEELCRGLAALEACTGERPVGYRSPSWQLTPATLRSLVDLKFLYDSSCMGDDRPYYERFAGLEILELPVHWSLDDVPHLSWSTGSTGPLKDPTAMLDFWRREVESAHGEQRPLVLTCHPEVIGRPAPSMAFSEFLSELLANPSIRFKRCVDCALSASSAGTEA